MPVGSSLLRSGLTASALASGISAASVPESVTYQAHWMLAPSAFNAAQNLWGPTWLARYDDTQIEPFPVVIQRFYWSWIEGAGSGTTSGSYDFSEIHTMLDACAARGKYFMPLLMHRKYETQTHSTPYGSTDAILPSDLVGTYQFATSGSSPPGFAGALYEPTVTTRFIALAQAVYDSLAASPNAAWFLGVQTEETAGMNQGPAYTLEKHKTALTDEWHTLADYAASLGKIFSPGFNFLEGAWGEGLAVLEGHWADVLNANGGLRTDNVYFYSSDMLLADSTNYGGNNSQVYPLQDPSYSGHVSAFNAYNIFGSMQNHSLQNAHNGGNDVDLTFTTLRPLYEGCIWTAAEYWDYTFAEARSGFTFGDARGVARLPWDHAYDSDYAVAA